ncbi:NADPH-dependent 1-acyl dihydroxyacetone phosphate reductase [Recurvomyces mirabilis]|uniref:NADPH-dependent 1-acyl dihydroxyacetone phosphate reductase n=1 Tax=Recurvomyces mirabilis TaxID=574656 RepID=A0AAE0WQF7_9PEZI|nr:NADPH-dependent 1-acyl dihydroxyacetone phosphate reductase [Recurvomyces mirabilis]KAK5153656.1 NADPH-dependent 1-acyl dihydroxyacetone phosphate reductase [Recurvomyces mirabilis]
MADNQRVVLISGCSDGGTGAALAKEFHAHGFLVYATARNVSKMASLSSLGIKTLELNIGSEDSIARCVKDVPHLDILINNAGGSYTMPVSDLSIAEAKKLFDTNLWGHVAVTQAFLPLLMKSRNAMIVNHTSVGAGMAIPFQAAYNASKAAMAMFSDTMRLELVSFGIKVVQMRTGGVKTNIISNTQAKESMIPADSIWSPARDLVNKALTLEWAESQGISPEQWAREVVADLTRPAPAPMVRRGSSAWVAAIASMLPTGWLDSMSKKLCGLDKIEVVIRTNRSS